MRTPVSSNNLAGLQGRPARPGDPEREEYLYGRTNLTVSTKSGDGRALGTETEKRIILRIDPNDESITLKDIMQRIQEIQRQSPDLDVFFDGDEYAVCSRPKEKARAIAETVEGRKKP